MKTQLKSFRDKIATPLENYTGNHDLDGHEEVHGAELDPQEVTVSRLVLHHQHHLVDVREVAEADRVEHRHDPWCDEQNAFLLEGLFHEMTKDDDEGQLI